MGSCYQLGHACPVDRHKPQECSFSHSICTQDETNSACFSCIRAGNLVPIATSLPKTVATCPHLLDAVAISWIFPFSKGAWQIVFAINHRVSPTMNPQERVSRSTNGTPRIARFEAWNGRKFDSVLDSEADQSHHGSTASGSCHRITVGYGFCELERLEFFNAAS